MLGDILVADTKIITIIRKTATKGATYIYTYTSVNASNCVCTEIAQFRACVGRVEKKLAMPTTNKRATLYTAVLYGTVAFVGC